MPFLSEILGNGKIVRETVGEWIAYVDVWLSFTEESSGKSDWINWELFWYDYVGFLRMEDSRAVFRNLLDICFNKRHDVVRDICELSYLGKIYQFSIFSVVVSQSEYKYGKSLLMEREGFFKNLYLQGKPEENKKEKGVGKKGEFIEEIEEYLRIWAKLLACSSNSNQVFADLGISLYQRVGLILDNVPCMKPFIYHGGSDETNIFGRGVKIYPLLRRGL